jgi:hypothetical protein
METSCIGADEDFLRIDSAAEIPAAPVPIITILVFDGATSTAAFSVSIG